MSNLENYMKQQAIFCEQNDSISKNLYLMFRNVRNGVADFFFARFKSGVHGSDALNHKLHVGNVQILLTALFGVILLR